MNLCIRIVDECKKLQHDFQSQIQFLRKQYVLIKIFAHTKLNLIDHKKKQSMSFFRLEN